MANSLTLSVNPILATRRSIPEEALAGMSKIEQDIFRASIRRTFGEMSQEEIGRTLRGGLTYTARDAGCRQFTQEDLQYITGRLVILLPRSYPLYSAEDFILAFELCFTGELDGFLPNGASDRSCYNNFSIEYICRVLNAYGQMRVRVINKVKDTQPPRPDGRDLRAEAKRENEVRADLVRCYLYYKYHGKIPHISPIAEMLYHERLAAVGLTDKIKVTEAERKSILLRAMTDFLADGDTYNANRLRREGTAAEDIQNPAFSLARRRGIRRAFDYLISHEYQITNYITPYQYGAEI